MLDDASSKLARSPPEERARGLIIGIFCSLVILPVIRVISDPSVEARVSCPSPTFSSGSMGSLAWLVPLLFVGMPRLIGSAILLGFWASCLIWPDSHFRFGVVSRTLLVTSLVGTLISGAGFYMFIGSYYCLMPSGILLKAHRGARPIMRSWDDVTAIRAECWVSSGKGPHTKGGNLHVLLRGEPEVNVRVGTDQEPVTPAYSALHRALWGKSYSYVFDAQTANRCPPQLLPLPRDWVR